MKKLICILLMLIICVGIVACKNKSASTINKVYDAGEEAFVLDNKDNQVYSLKINRVKIANDFEYKEDFSDNTEQIIEVDYTYKNIAKDDEVGLQIHGADLQVADSEGTIAESSPMFPKQAPQDIMPGTNCNVHAYYGLSNKSDEVKIIFKSDMHGTTLTFEVPVE